MNSFKKNILKGMAVGCLFMLFFITPKTGNSYASCDALEVYHNCTETAYQNYESGLYSRDLYYEFVGNYCKDAAGSCL